MIKTKENFKFHVEQSMSIVKEGVIVRKDYTKEDAIKQIYKEVNESEGFEFDGDLVYDSLSESWPIKENLLVCDYDDDQYENLVGNFYIINNFFNSKSLCVYKTKNPFINEFKICLKNLTSIPEIYFYEKNEFYYFDKKEPQKSIYELTKKHKKYEKDRLYVLIKKHFSKQLNMVVKNL